MIVNAVKTDKITTDQHTLTDVLDSAISSLQERSVLVITSKIVSICEGRVVKIGTQEKDALIRKEADLYIPPTKSKYDITLTITRNTLIPTAGIDESNGNDYYILWPVDPYRTAKEIRAYLAKRFSLSEVGVLITDSRTSPLRWGTMGVALAYAGFDALNNYIGTPDIFGRKLKVTKANVADGLSAAAVAAMGEGDEQTPLAVITDCNFVHFKENAPSDEDLKDIAIDPSEDLYGPLIQSAPWEKGSGK
jgi:putative folate metabolism gamma-glutamate ligase